MGRKKHLKGLSDEEVELISTKMLPSSSVEYVDGFKRTLRGLGYKLNIKCKTSKQKDFLNNLKDDKNIICFGIGSAGTGKSYISLSYGLSKLKDGTYDKVIIVVPTAQATGRDMQFGFLKGELEDKTKPFKDVDRYTIEKILKTCDNVDYKTYASYLIDNGFIQYEFINFMLGKTFDNSLILVNEAEQYTKDDMKLILTRIGENSKLVLTGDCEQTNRQTIVNKKEICGLSYAADRLSDMDEVGVTEFNREDIVRNQLIGKILDRLD